MNIFICHPLRDDVPGNLAKVNAIARQIADGGDLPIIPHHTCHYFQANNVQDDAIAMKMIIDMMIPLCNVFLVCGTRITAGMKPEIDRALFLGKKVAFECPEAMLEYDRLIRTERGGMGVM